MAIGKALQFRQDLPPALSENRTAGNTKRHVGAEAPPQQFQFRLIHTCAEKRVKAAQNGGCVRAASSEAGADGNPLRHIQRYSVSLNSRMFEKNPNGLRRNVFSSSGRYLKLVVISMPLPFSQDMAISSHKATLCITMRMA
jgi:hypothetical protein